MNSTNQLQTWYNEVWNNANEKYMHEALHPEAIVHGLQTDNTKKGHDAFLPFYKNFREQFPKVEVTLEPIFSYDGFEAAQCTVSATNASGKTAKFSGISIAKFEDGKLVEGWNGFDFLTMYQQLDFNLVEQQ